MTIPTLRLGPGGVPRVDGRPPEERMAREMSQALQRVVTGAQALALAQAVARAECARLLRYLCEASPDLASAVEALETRLRHEGGEPMDAVNEGAACADAGPQDGAEPAP
jgi:hypothetical protein